MMPVTVQPSLNLIWRQPFFNLAHPSLKFGTLLQDPACPQDVQGVFSNVNGKSAHPPKGKQS